MHRSLVSPIGSIIEVFVTGDAVPLLFPLMSCHVFLQACFPCKSLSTEVTLPWCAVALMVALHVSFHNLGLFEQFSTLVTFQPGIWNMQGGLSM